MRAVTAAWRGSRRRSLPEVFRFGVDCCRLACLYALLPAAGFSGTWRLLERRFHRYPREVDRRAALARARSCCAALRRFPLPTSCLHAALLKLWALRALGLEAGLRVSLTGGAPGSSGHAWATHAGLPLHEPTGAGLDITDLVLSAAGRKVAGWPRSPG